MKIVFFGTSLFAARILSALIAHELPILAVVTRADKPKGRNRILSPPPVKEWVQQEMPHLPLFQPPKASAPEFLATLQALKADLFLVVAYGEILRSSVLEIPPRGCVNIHASLLPAYRGAAPMQRALMDGVSETGITLIEMNAQMDAGDVLAIESTPVSPTMNLGELETTLEAIAIRLMLDLLPKIEEGAVERHPQDGSHATLAPKITPEETRIDWQKPAWQLHNLVRALSPKPGAWCELSIQGASKRLKILRAACEPHLTGKPGERIALTPQEWVVGCGSGGALRILEVQLEGKKVMPVRDFLSGLAAADSIVHLS